MHQLITKSYNGFVIEFELIDGQLMANATSMCAAFGKRPNDWTKTASAKRFIEAKAKKVVLADSQMIYVKAGGNDNGTWIHECLILKLAAWLNVDFEIQCDEWIAELLRTGRVEIAPPKTQAEMLLMFAQHNVEQERRMAAIEETVQEVKAKLTTRSEDYYTVAGFASLRRRQVPVKEAARLGKQATALSKQEGLPISSTHDPRFGHVNTYHKDVLSKLF